jgi:hypothetical protein
MSFVIKPSTIPAIAGRLLAGTTGTLCISRQGRT